MLKPGKHDRWLTLQTPSTLLFFTFCRRVFSKLHSVFLRLRIGFSVSSCCWVRRLVPRSGFCVCRPAFPGRLMCSEPLVCQLGAVLRQLPAQKPWPSETPHHPGHSSSMAQISCPLALPSWRREPGEELDCCYSTCCLTPSTNPTPTRGVRVRHGSL